MEPDVNRNPDRTNGVEPPRLKLVVTDGQPLARRRRVVSPERPLRIVEHRSGIAAAAGRFTVRIGQRRRHRREGGTP